MSKQRFNSDTPKPTHCLSPSNNTKSQTSMQKTHQGAVGRGRQYLKTSIKVRVTLEEAINHSHANG